MPIPNVNDAAEVREKLADLLNADDTNRRVEAARSLFVETLDWQYADRLILLHSAQSDNLPSDARLIANRDGTSAVYIPPANAETNRITAAAVNAAARSLSDTLAGDLLLLFTNGAGDEFHIVRPDLTHARPRLQRMVARRGERHRTIEEQLANMWNDYGRKGKSVHEAIIAAFSVEPVTKRFFDVYRRVFEDAKNAITGFDTERELHLFTQTLFNRLMFVYFVSRKGWLKFNGSSDYLNALWQAYLYETSQTNFYTARLEPFFFDGLNNPGARDLRLNDPALYALIGDIEFLNGGLFEKGRLDGGVTVPDGVIEPILTELFDRFNFTVTESTPYDTEVAVDPEMLGRVFEELVNERHESGAYYTPRPVVSFMCREALKGFLASATTGLADDAIREFVDAQNTQDISVADARQVAAALERVTVVDPACGSGAYLLGMMQELVDLQTTLFNVGVDAKSIYDLKLEIIQRNLYGADIDGFAVNIAMLRLWLSLVIEYEGDKPEPLPNLDFKIACGDSLLAPDPNPAEQGNIFTEAIRNSKLSGLKGEYLRENRPEHKHNLRERIAEVEEKLRLALGGAAASDDVVDWLIKFAEVMGGGGFDIVVANPPYVNMVEMEKTDAEYRGEIRSLFQTARGAFDIFVPFIERGFQVLSSSGVMAFVVPNKMLSAEYAKTVRKYAVRHSQILSITDLSDVSVFGASVYPIIFLATKRKESENNYGVQIYHMENADTGHEVVSGHSATISIVSEYGNLWSPLLDREAVNLLRAIVDLRRLEEVAQVNGAATVSEAYALKDAVIDVGIQLTSQDPTRYRPFIVSGNIRPYHHTWHNKPVQYIKQRYTFPALDTLHPAVRDSRREQIMSSKLVVSGMSKRPTCVWDTGKVAPGKSTIIVIPNESINGAFLCGLLNSEFMRRVYNAMFGSLSLSGGYLRFGPPQLKLLPVPNATTEEQRHIADLVEKRIFANEKDVANIDAQIDREVAALFGIEAEWA